jgi:3-dehydroquinate dehydratase-2
MRFLIINGPNINMLGIREPSVYGRSTYADLVKLVDNFCADESVECEFFQSNHEGCIVDKIQDAYGKFDGIVINPAAYTHTSIAILDALKAVAIPTVEVHISNVSERESFRQISFVSYYALKTYQGLGFDGYIEAVKFLKEYILLDKTQ